MDSLGRFVRTPSVLQQIVVTFGNCWQLLVTLADCGNFLQLLVSIIVPKRASKYWYFLYILLNITIPWVGSWKEQNNRKRPNDLATVIHLLSCQLWFKAKSNTIAQVSHSAESRHCWYCIVSCAWSSHQLSELKCCLHKLHSLHLFFLMWEVNPFVETSWSGT